MPRKRRKPKSRARAKPLLSTRFSEPLPGRYRMQMAYGQYAASVWSTTPLGEEEILIHQITFVEQAREYHRP